MAKVKLSLCLIKQAPYLTFVQKHNVKLHGTKWAVIRRNVTRRETIVNNFSVRANEEEQILGEVTKPGLNPEKIYSLSFEDRRRETARALSIICDVVIYSSSVKNGSFRSCMTGERKFQWLSWQFNANENPFSQWGHRVYEGYSVSVFSKAQIYTEQSHRDWTDICV